MFTDVVTIRVKAGKGGNGLTSWRREKFVAKGGPDGGDGGEGGSVLLQADANLDTLANFRNKPLITAGAGENGKRRRQHGKSGEDTIVKIPTGTVVWDDGNQLADLTAAGQTVSVAQGGKGGFGNAHFSSSVRQAPQVSEIGEDGQELELRLELKLIADVGLIGLPNAGKSTLLSVISNARPEIADYPFTTLVPNLGVADIDNHSLLVADIPGLIKGASKGKGLGDTFLRHIERTAVLLHLIDVNEDVSKAYQTIRQELQAYRIDLSKKPQVVVLTKIDAMEENEVTAKLHELKQVTKDPIFVVSAAAHKNLHKLLREALKVVKTERRKARRRQPKAEVPTFTLADDPNAWGIEKKRRHYVIRGQKVEGFARRTDYRSHAGMQRLRDILHKQGIDRELVRLGVKTGDNVEISSKTFQW